MNLPQEIEVWYIIPTIRKELALELRDVHGLSQKDIAKILKISPAAVSQYSKKKRAKNIKFDEEVNKMIKESAAILAEHPGLFLRELSRLTHFMRDTEVVCKIHLMYDSKVDKDCRECFFVGVEDGR